MSKFHIDDKVFQLMAKIKLLEDELGGSPEDGKGFLYKFGKKDQISVNRQIPE